MRRILRHMTYANVMSTIAAVAALTTGGAWAAATITGKQIRDGSIASRDIGNRQVKTADIAGSAVKGGKLASGAVVTGKLAAGAVTSGKLAAGAVDGSKVADGALSGADLQDGTVSTADLSDGSVTGAKLAAENVVGMEHLKADVQFRLGNSVSTEIATGTAIGPSGSGTSTVQCDVGTSAVAWGSNYDADLRLISAVRADVRTWQVSAFNAGADGATLQATAVCLSS